MANIKLNDKAKKQAVDLLRAIESEANMAIYMILEQSVDKIAYKKDDVDVINIYTTNILDKLTNLKKVANENR